MKIGLGFYRSQLTQDNFRFAVQAGATHVVAHLTNYFAGRDPKIFSGDPREGWGDCSQALVAGPLAAERARTLSWLPAGDAGRRHL